MRRCAWLLGALAVASACSGGDDTADGTATAGTTAITTARSDSSRPATSSPASTPAPTIATTAATAAPTPPSTAATTASSAPASTFAPADTGVPGLDSDDAFCAAWSRFGGSWQVALAAAAFGTPDEAARLEVLASTVVGAAYDDMFAAWPDELDAEREVVADGFFGPFQRRSADALAALSASGADEDDLALLGDVWLDALAARPPGQPVLDVGVPPDLDDTVVAAADRFREQRTPLGDDPSMVITASTPLTDEFLATGCPDAGSILGGDVVGG